MKDGSQRIEDVTGRSLVVVPRLKWKIRRRDSRFSLGHENESATDAHVYWLRQASVAADAGDAGAEGIRACPGLAS